MEGFETNFHIILGTFLMKLGGFGGNLGENWGEVLNACTLH